MYRHVTHRFIPIVRSSAYTKVQLISNRRQVDHVDSPSDLYATLMALILRLARSGLIHGDFNEFNILIRRRDGEAILIDFPQMVSTRHENAEL